MKAKSMVEQSQYQRCAVLCLLCLMLGPASGLLAQESANVEGKLNRIIIRTAEIFEETENQHGFVPNLVNSLHIVTRESVIRREVWLQAGDWISHDDREELERNLRALDLFAEVTVSTQAADGSGVDLLIEARDRLSIVLSGGGTFLGGVGEVQFSVGERNLFGLGHRLTFGYAENSLGELLGSLAYDNVLLAGNDVYADVRLGRTEEGNFGSIELKNRFLNLRDTRSWSIEVATQESRRDYFEEGESVAEVPRVIDSVELLAQRRLGNDKRYWRFGPSLSYRDTQYGSAIGVNAATIEVPEDAERFFLGGLLAYDYFQAFRKINWLDTLRFPQDLTLGTGYAMLVGFEHERTELSSSTLPFVAINAWAGRQFGAHNYFDAYFESLASVNDGDLARWSLAGTASWFNTEFSRQTLAVNLSYKSAGSDGSSLPSEQSLGENNGLRGYPAREFNGEQLVLLNLEDRIKTDVNFASFDLGLIAFFDVGWVSDRGEGFGGAHSAAGFGLRVGSRALLGNRVVRLDLAFPFDDDPLRDYQPSISLAVGQVFDFDP